MIVEISGLSASPFLASQVSMHHIVSPVARCTEACCLPPPPCLPSTLSAQPLGDAHVVCMNQQPPTLFSSVLGAGLSDSSICGGDLIVLHYSALRKPGQRPVGLFLSWLKDMVHATCAAGPTGPLERPGLGPANAHPFVWSDRLDRH